MCAHIPPPPPPHLHTNIHTHYTYVYTPAWLQSLHYRFIQACINCGQAFTKVLKHNVLKRVSNRHRCRNRGGPGGGHQIVNEQISLMGLTVLGGFCVIFVELSGFLS